MLFGLSCFLVRLFLSMFSRLVEKVVIGVFLVIFVLGLRRFCMVFLWGMVICWLGMLIMLELVWVMKYRLYIWLRMKVKVLILMMKIVVFRVIVWIWLKKFILLLLLFCLWVLVKFLCWRVLSMLLMLIILLVR